MESATARSVPSILTTAASAAPVPATVFPWTSESYCSHTHRLLDTLGEPRTRRKARRRSSGGSSKAGSSACTSSSHAGRSVGRSYSGVSSARERAGTSATTRPPILARSIPSPVTRPITVERRPHRRQTLRTSARRSGLTIANIRSCDSDVRISCEPIPGSRSGTASRSISAPVPARAADSETAQVIPAPPRSWRPTSIPASAISRHASISSFSWNGSPIWTLALDASLAPSRVREASTETPPMPSRPVWAPIRSMRLPSPSARAGRRRSAGASPTHMTFTVGLVEWGSANFSSPPTVGTPIEFPYCPIPATTPDSSHRFRGSSSEPNRRGSRRATGRAPIERTSRTIPPTPVAAPWKGSTAEGWLWLSILKTQASPSPMSTAPAFSPGPTSTRSPSVGSRRRWTLLDL